MSEAQFPVADLGSGLLINVIDNAVDRLFAFGASDVTIQSDDYIWAYVNRQHVQASNRRLDDGEVSAIVRHLYNSDGANGILGSGRGLDFDADIRPRLIEGDNFDPDYSVRCRVNVTQCRVATVANGYSITLRTIPGIPPTFESLDLPEEIAENFFPSQGLVLVVGITGSGKSTLLAAGNRKRLETTDNPVKIGTYEDPIEFVYPRVPAILNADPGQSLARMPEISQAQIGTHLADFALAAPNALRRKFDVLVMGEMRDRESVETGLLLAATGHATYGTLHCETPAEAISRIVSEFPYDAQPSIANKLLSNLRLIVAQKIERTVEGKGRAFRSWCVFDQAFKAELFEHQHQHWNQLVTARMRAAGTTFAQQALGPYKAGLISDRAFANIAGFNPVEAREYLRVHGGGQ